MISEEEGKKCGFGSHVVTVLPHFMVKLQDNVHLAVKFWFPESNASEKYFNNAESTTLYEPENHEAEKTYPVVMEYLPYRKADSTSPRDYRRHTWMASHGYVIARVDMRGSGDSEGVYYDEYLAQEQQDACEIIAWFAEQSWCNKKVGMYGKSWGGFNGLQVAYEQPEALKAIISVYSTDDRYATDTHYEGGCVLGIGMPSWATRMLIWNANPPCPKYNKDWKELWKGRLEKGSDPLLTKWMSHQLRDDYWKHGSINEDFTKIKAAVLAIGGWSDAYFDAVFRLVENIPSAKGIVGPWPHDWPDACEPGPLMEYMTECLNWWNHHLKDIDNEVPKLPKMRIFQIHSNPPAAPPKLTVWPGQWLAFENWPLKETKDIVLFPNNTDHNLCFEPDKCNVETWKRAYFNSSNGLLCGEWLSNGQKEIEGPFDERSNDELSLSWTSDELVNDVKICGDPKFTCKLKINKGNQGQIIVRLCDVFPDGRSKYVTRGVLNLTHRNGHEPDQQEDLVPGEIYTIVVQLHTIAYIVPEDHKVRLSVSPSYWPTIWPSNADPEMEIMTEGENTFLTLPVLSNVEDFKIDEKMEAHMVAKNPLLGPPLPQEMIRDGSYDVTVEYHPCRGISSRRATFDSGKVKHKDTNTILDDFFSATETAEIKDGDPLSANVVITSSLKLSWPDDGIKTGSRTFTKMWATETDFHMINTLDVFCNDELFFNRDWHDVVPREFV